MVAPDYGTSSQKSNNGMAEQWAPVAKRTIRFPMVGVLVK
jgi:hypothetical protein